MNKADNMTLITWYQQLLLPYWKHGIAAILALLIGSGGWLTMGQALRYGIDSGFISENSEATIIAGIALLFVTLIISFATYWRFYLMTWIGEKVSADIRTQVYSHMLTLGPAFYAKTRTGEVISRFTSDTSILQTVIGSSFSMGVRSLVTFTGAILLMLTASTTLTLAVLLCVPVILLPLRFFAPKLRKLAKASQDRVADLGAHIDQSLHEIATVQAYTAERQEDAFFQQRVKDALYTAMQRIKYRAWLIAIVMGCSMASIILIGWLGVTEVQNQAISIGELTAFLFYAVMAGGSIATISEVVGDIQRAAGASERLHDLLLTKNHIQQGTATIKPLTDAPSLRFSDVSFRYDTQRELFSHFNLSIAPGEHIALVGPSGAGKSTLFNLLLRFWQPSNGQIFINNIDIASLTLHSLRRQFSVVDQSAVVFADTVLNNIRYGKPDATTAQVEQAAKQAYAHEFISQLSDGYHSLLGERGVNLSGGQKQRIAIARAILAERPILLLDEATSALDAQSEAHIQEALSKLMQSRTSIVIAHRLATVKDVDKIVVLDKGAIQAIGRHEELIKNNELYRQYAELQLMK
jgi:ATP-binding cassette subfamily B protein